jgi:hypothetical protein
MHWACRVVVALAAAGLVAPAAFADVIPTRRAEPSDSARKVEARLVELGTSPQAAADQAGSLTSRECAYFARDLNRVQLAGQEIWGGQSDNLWWEWVFGLGALAGVGFGYYVFGIRNDD